MTDVLVTLAGLLFGGAAVLIALLIGLAHLLLPVFVIMWIMKQ